MFVANIYVFFVVISLILSICILLLFLPDGKSYLMVKLWQEKPLWRHRTLVSIKRIPLNWIKLKMLHSHKQSIVLKWRNNPFCLLLYAQNISKSCTIHKKVDNICCKWLHATLFLQEFLFKLALNLNYST